MEGSRISETVGLYRDVITDTAVQDGGPNLNLNPGDRVLLDLVTASQDPTAFPDPETVKLD